MEKRSSLALDADHRRRLATILGDLACEYDGGGPYVSRALVSLQGVRLAALGDQFEAVRDRLEEGRKNPATCPGVAGFSEADWHWLGWIKKYQDLNAPKTTPGPAYSP